MALPVCMYPTKPLLSWMSVCPLFPSQGLETNRTREVAACVSQQETSKAPILTEIHWVPEDT